MSQGTKIEWADDTTASVWLARLGKAAAGRELDGRTWDEIPSVAS